MPFVFQFANIHEFMLMAGHGPYVWVSYIITFAGIGLLAFLPVYARRTFIKIQRSIAQREAL